MVGGLSSLNEAFLGFSRALPKINVRTDTPNVDIDSIAVKPEPKKKKNKRPKQPAVKLGLCSAARKVCSRIAEGYLPNNGTNMPYNSLLQSSIAKT